MNKLGHAITASLLVVVFGVFNIGVPIVHYLCPMMNDDVAACPKSQQSRSQDVSFTDQSPSCCASFIVAERNTTPFTSVEKFVSQQIQTQSLTVSNSCIAQFPLLSATVPFGTSTSPPLSAEPLYILNSSILI